jgi:hypothetical protein
MTEIISASAPPTVTTDLMACTGLNHAMLAPHEHGSCDPVRADPMLGPAFAGRITEWGPHLAKFVDFWPSAALITEGNHGAPAPKYLPLSVESAHFDRGRAALLPRPSAIGVGQELATLLTISPQPHDIPMQVGLTETGLHTPKEQP